jgi:predicted TIM-barrel fold metal-dependent hydrolase
MTPLSSAYPLYKERIAPHLPPVILDFHAHTWRKSDWHAVPWKSGAAGGTYMVADEDYPVQRLIQDGRASFPDREYRAVCFGYPTPSADNEKDTRYVAAAGGRRGMYPLMIAGAPLKLPAELIRQRLLDGKFLGFKVYLPWHGDAYGDMRVQDMLSANEMDIAQDLGLVVLLHVPRSGRLADPDVQAGVRWLSEGWPRARIVLAHCGRCYLPAEMERAIGSVRDLSNVCLDTSMVMDETVLRMVFDGIDSSRVLFATDFPVAAMKGRRVRVMDHWVDVVTGEAPASAYRVPAEGIGAMYMSQEIALAVVTAGRAAGLAEKSLRDVFFENGMRLLRSVDNGAALERVEKAWRGEEAGG